jgi:LmbE family N-acetylglucosaminyl deacetylase
MTSQRNSSFRFTRLTQNQKKHFTHLDALMATPGGVAQETWLFVGAHDDDICIGAGFWLQAAVQAGVTVWALIVTDGRMGYCTAEQEPNIAQIRHQEALASFEILGLPANRILFLDYPDNDLAAHQGRRKARPGQRNLGGYTGLQNDFTWQLRHLRPQRLFIPAESDTHPDHKITYTELMISIFHATGAIWPELGRPLVSAPVIYEAAIYEDFRTPPNLELQADAQAYERRLQSVLAYESQGQIAGVIEEIKALGAYEYLYEHPFPQYNPRQYRQRFA